MNSTILFNTCLLLLSILLYDFLLCYGFCFFFQAEDGIRDAQESRGLGDVYKRQYQRRVRGLSVSVMAEAECGPSMVTPPSSPRHPGVSCASTPAEVSFDAGESPTQPETNFSGMPEGSTVTLGPAAASHARAALLAWSRGWDRVSISVLQSNEEPIQDDTPTILQFTLAAPKHNLAGGFRQWRSASDASRCSRVCCLEG
eukprot:TRINITY_DN12969_c0_g1_i5.p1 TRINITY_DN12969_c0_g1~~TRINITY_DN12969_c0_g1_i5.p1  ORF type:complete len:200 (-),score=24.25 TRINITY_DN12969_c0_g1_i5:415-1014(-)